MNSFTTRRDEIKKAMEDTSTLKEDTRKVIKMANTYTQSRITLDLANDIFVTRVSTICGVTKTTAVNYLIDHIRAEDIEGASKYFAMITNRELVRD